MDDFGNSLFTLVLDIGIPTLNQYCRFLADGMAEGIASDILSGTLDDDSMRFFGLIA